MAWITLKLACPEGAENLILERACMPRRVRRSAWFGVRAARRGESKPPDAGFSHALLVVLRLPAIADPELAVLVFVGELIEQPPQTPRHPRVVVHVCDLRDPKTFAAERNAVMQRPDRVLPHDVVERANVLQ